RVDMAAMLPDVWIDRQRCGRVECMLVAGRDVERNHLLSLILVRLVQRVRNLKPVAGQKEVHMQRVFIVGHKVKAVESVLAIPNGVDGTELRRVEEQAGCVSILNDEQVGHESPNT